MNGAQKVDKRKVEINKFSLIFNKLGIYVVVLLLIVAGVILSGGQFFSASNIQSILEASALIGMVSAGLVFVVYSGNMNDMSIPMTMAMAGMLTVQFINLGFIPALLIGIASGALIGFINGLMIGKFRAHPIIWSWGFNLLLSGIVRVVWQGKQLYADTVAKPTEFAQRAANTFYAISRTYLTSFISLMAVVMIMMFIIAWFIHSKTTFGQKLKIIGTKKITDAGIPAFCSNTLPEASAMNFIRAYTGPNDWSQMRVLANQLGQDLGGKGGVAYITHNVGGSPYYARCFGPMSELGSKYPEIQHLDIQSPGFEASAVKQVVSDWITKYGDQLNAIVLADDSDQAIGAAEACKAAGRDDIIIVAAGISKQGAELIQSGDLSACSYQSCQGDAGLAVRTVAEFFNGEDIARVSFIGTDIINAENVESFLPCQW